MNYFEYVSETSLATKNVNCIESMAFDGYNYYGLIHSECTVIKYNLKFQKEKSIRTSRKYNRLCYDYKSCCFWATSESCTTKIFKLDLCLQEIDYIELINCLNMISTPVGISFNCCSNSIIVAYPSGIIEVDKITGKFVVKYASKDLWITGILSICPGYMVNVATKNKNYIYVLDSSYKKIKDYFIKEDYVVKNIMFNPCKENCGKLAFYSLVIKRNCYPYIVKTILDTCDLGFTPCKCNFEICRKNPCRECKGKDPICDIMESIALEQTALSHILNAEGEKIQKVIAVTDDINKILEVNKEVNKTIIHVTHLEQVLYEKLVAAIECKHVCNNQCKNRDQCHCEEGKVNFSDLNYDEWDNYEKWCDYEKIYEDVNYPQYQNCRRDEGCYDCNKYPKYNEWSQYEDYDIYQQCYKCRECSQYKECTKQKKCEKCEKSPTQDNDEVKEF